MSQKEAKPMEANLAILDIMSTRVTQREAVKNNNVFRDLIAVKAALALHTSHCGVTSDGARSNRTSEKKLIV